MQLTRARFIENSADASRCNQHRKRYTNPRSDSCDKISALIQAISAPICTKMGVFLFFEKDDKGENIDVWNRRVYRQS